MKIIHEGIKKYKDYYIIDYKNNTSEDIIHIEPPQLYQKYHNNHIYWFGYKFNSDVSSKDRTEFIHYLKGLDDKKISEEDLIKLIELPLSELDNQINLYWIDCFVYPLSGRSPLVTTMVQIINNFTSREMTRLSFELIKSAPIDVEFDWELFYTEHPEESKQTKQMVKYINNELLPKIHNLDYFSLASNVKTKYRKYIKNFIQLQQKDIAKLKALRGENILIVDDINSSGNTLNEILRIIGEINHSCNIYVYTLIGK